MPRRPTTTGIPSLGAVDRAADQVGRQIAQALRAAIAKGELKAGELLPSTRTLSASLRVARGTVMGHSLASIPVGRADQCGAAPGAAVMGVAPQCLDRRGPGHPFPSVQGLDPSRVVYLGTLSKVLFPSLRLGYVVAPAALIDAFGAPALLDRHSPTADQHVLAAYMREGFSEAHIRRIHGVYAARR